MASQRIDDLNALDWDDSALIKAYNKGMSLRVNKVKEFEEENAKEKRRDSKKEKWMLGDFCRAVYPSDNLVYEAKIVELNGDVCIVDFLGYNEEMEVDVDTLTKSKGKHARKKQMRRAKEYYPSASADESASGDDSRNDYSEVPSPSLKRKDASNLNPMIDHSTNYTAAESTFQHSMYPAPAAHYTTIPSAAAIPPPPPMMQGADVSQNPSLCAMLSSWYMAGYYTGLHQAQRNQCHQRCCRSAPNCCH